MNKLKIDSNLAELEKMRAFLRESFEGLNVSDKDYFKIELALLEICINIIRYAYPNDKGQIFLKIWQSEGKMFLEIRDWGVPFDPRELKEPDIQEIIESEKKGGLGVFLSRKLMDGFDYKREKDQNVLTIYKSIKEAEASL
jgi:anti-sigma regulatory factor (Ser/Thr protein kinase)